MSELVEERPKKGRAKKVGGPKVESEGSEPKLVKRQLPVKLSDAEKLLKADELARSFEERDGLETEKKIANDGFKARIELVEQRASQIAAVLRAGEERRDVECIERHIYATNTVEVIRVDSQEIVEKRAMFLHERQPSLPIDESPAFDDEDGSSIDDPDHLLGEDD